MRLVERTFRGLEERDAVLRVPLCLVEATNLVLELLADGKAGRVVRCLVDSEPTGKLLNRLEETALRAGEVPLR